MWTKLITVATAVLLIATYARSDTVYQVYYANDTGEDAYDLHINVNNTGDKDHPSDTKRFVKDRGTSGGNGASSDKWRNTPGAGKNTGSTADFDNGPDGKPIASGAYGYFWVRNNTNYINITSAYWTDKNGNAIKKDEKPATPKWTPKVTELSFNFTTDGDTELAWDPFTDGLTFTNFLVKTDVPLSELESMADAPTFADFSALTGHILADTSNGGAQTFHSSSPLQAGCGMIFYAGYADGTSIVAWSDAQPVPLPGAFIAGAAMMAAGCLVHWQRRRDVAG
jgi:hypothetical protein